MTALTDLQLQVMFKGLSDAALYCPFDGDADDDAGTLTPSTETGGIIYDDDTVDGMAKIGDAIQLAESAVNLIFNPRFESNITDGWDVGGGDGTPAYDNTKSKLGSGCLKITAGTALTYLTTEAADECYLLNGDTITLSGWIWAATTAADHFIRIYDRTNAAIRATAAASTIGSWEFVSVSYTNATGGTIQISVYCVNDENDGSTISWFDCIQLQAGSYPTPYTDGALGTGHTWGPASWNQLFDEEIADFDAVSPAWDGEVDAVGDFDAEVDADGDLNDAGAAAHDGAVGLEITFDDANAAYGTINADAIDQTSGVVSFWLNMNDVALSAGTVMDIIGCADGGATVQWLIRYREDSDTIIAGAVHDAAGVNWTAASSALSTTWHHVLLMFKRATGAGQNNGILRLYVDGIFIGEVTNIDNDTKDWDNVRVGMTFTNSTAFSGSFYMDTIKIDPVGGPFVSKLAAINGTYGLAMPLADQTTRYVAFTDPANDVLVTAECWIDPNALTMANTDEFYFLSIEDGAVVGGQAQCVVAYLNYTTADGYRIRMRVFEDDGTSTYTPYEDITDGSHLIRMVWGASSGADDGYAHLCIDNVLKQSLIGLDTDQKNVDNIYLAAAGIDVGTYGIFFLDHCRWSDDITAHNSASIRLPSELEYTLTAGTAFTVGLWWAPHILANEHNNACYLWHWYEDGNNYIRLVTNYSANEIRSAIKVNGNLYNITAIHTPVRFTPVHIVITWDGTTLRSYANGSASGTPIAAGDSWGTAPSEVHLGHSTAEGKHACGYYDELLILDYALSASEVDLLYNEAAVNALSFAGIWTNVLVDVRAKEGIQGGGGIKGNGPKDRVPSTGRLQFYMDNSIANSTATAGYYSPDHGSARTGFDLGIETRLRWSYGGQDYYPWRGRIFSIEPEAGKYGARRTKVVAHDWMGAAMRHKVGLLPVETSVRSDTAMTTIIDQMEHAPQITSYGTGQETFAYFPDQTKDEKSTVAALAQKICMSEFGFLIRIGDTTTGETVLYQNRHARVTNFSLEATITDVWLTDLKLVRSQQHMANVVKAITYPREIGSSAEDLFTLQTAIEIAAGETKTYTARYTDPSERASRISAHTLEDPEGANELDNRGFETDASGWTAAAGGSFAQSDDQAKHDSYSGKLTSGAGGANTYYVESDVWSGPVQNDVIYYQVYVLASDTWPSSILVEISEYDAGDVIGTTTTLDTVGTSTSGIWVRYSGTHTCIDGDCAKVKIRVGTGRGGAHDFSGGAVNLYIDEAYLIDDAAIIFEFSSSDVGGGDLNGDLVLIESTLGGNSAELVWENVGSVAGFVTIQKVRGLAIRVYDPITYEAVVDSTLVAKHERRELPLRLPFQDSPLVGEDFAMVTRDKYQDPLTMVNSGTFVANKHATPMAAAMTVEPGDRIKYTETQTGISEEYFVNGKEFIIYPDAAGLGTLWMTWFVIAASVEAFWLIGTVGASEIGSYTWVGW